MTLFIAPFVLVAIALIIVIAILGIVVTMWAATAMLYDPSYKPELKFNSVYDRYLHETGRRE